MEGASGRRSRWTVHRCAVSAVAGLVTAALSGWAGNAGPSARLWDYLLELDPDIAVLQDFGAVPERVLQQYTHARNAKPLAVGHAHAT